MNKRYMELDKQASDYYWSLDDGERKAEAYTKKFAELIVRECANIVNSLEQYEGQGDCSTAEYIKEHFGVEQ